MFTKKDNAPCKGKKGNGSIIGYLLVCPGSLC